MLKDVEKRLIWERRYVENEEVDEHLLGIGAPSGLILWMCRGIKGHKNQMPKMRGYLCH